MWIFHPGDPTQMVPGPDPDTDEGGKVLEADVRDTLAHREVIVCEGHSGPLYGFALADWRKTDEGDIDDTEIPGAEMPRTYQIVVANGCNTYDLGQAFWKNPAKSDHTNINVITTTSFSNAGTEASAKRIIGALYEPDERPSRGVAGVRARGFARRGSRRRLRLRCSVCTASTPTPSTTRSPIATKLCASCASDADCGADGNRCTQISTSRRRSCTSGCVDDTGCDGGLLVQEHRRT